MSPSSPGISSRRAPVGLLAPEVSWRAPVRVLAVCPARLPRDARRRRTRPMIPKNGIYRAGIPFSAGAAVSACRHRGSRGSNGTVLSSYRGFLMVLTFRRVLPQRAPKPGDPSRRRRHCVTVPERPVPMARTGVTRTSERAHRVVDRRTMRAQGVVNADPMAGGPGCSRSSCPHQEESGQVR
jgi:hypothetical protein